MAAFRGCADHSFTCPRYPVYAGFRRSQRGSARVIIVKDYTTEYDRNAGAYRIRGRRPPVCPDCGRIMSVYDTRRRHAISATGAPRWFLLRRLLCPGCGKLHIELPDFLRPRKHYDSQVIDDTVAGRLDCCPADDSTIRRWRSGHDPPSLPSLLSVGAVCSQHTDTKEE
ncbi:DUF6431 domain-containing protein [Anaerotruncus rubiinfantis]|uniref:DUF6431 domain-containing protein n=1 Tax=Anaerotruncus rubiinfantis TaxID=1720200 RepID=UPI003C2B6CE9